MKIVIAGFGTEGKASYAYWNVPGNEVTIADEREIPAQELPLNASVITGEGVFSRLEGFDMVVRTASLAPHKIKTNGKIWSATNEFFAQCQVPIIGVTGTKGKGTTSSLIASILRAAGKNVHLVGNIGVPALEVLGSIQPDDIVVYELSSFQLWDLEKSPQVAVVLGIEPDHLDIHLDYADYIAAKGHSTENQSITDRVVFNVHNEAAVSIAGLSVGQRLPYPSERTAHIRGSYFYYGDSELCETSQLQLPGEHNIENACAAITAVWPWVQDPAVIAEGLRSFDGLPHRLKFVREVRGVEYYDDSIATTPGSAIAALRAFRKPTVIILGGSDKGAEYEEVIKECRYTGAEVVAIGQTGAKIQELCLKFGVNCERVEGGMEEVVRHAREIAENEMEDYISDAVIILSPASASFDQYKNYADRGEQFIAAVEKLS
jgi:UDP-N-acetylmuramoylalanine--D-glutamate ligase